MLVTPDSRTDANATIALDEFEPHGSPLAHPLTCHELAILEALADGAQSKEMAAAIHRSRGTVEFYIRSLFLKLNARSRPHLVAQAYRKGLLPVRAVAAGDKT
jgi:DNA-binding NarL/FixJ family response regulator